MFPRCFNPRAREGRDFPCLVPAVIVATFQSTRPRRARLESTSCRASWCCFNPRAREGRDGRQARVAATRWRFNPRAREGRDGEEIPTEINLEGFNPRAREGRDPASRWATVNVQSFQSTRPRRARLQIMFGVCGGCAVSIHAPAKGATRWCWRPRSPPPKFQSTRPRRARLGRVAPLREGQAVSIHAPAKGATSRAARCGRSRRFNPRAREGRDSSSVGR